MTRRGLQTTAMRWLLPWIVATLMALPALGGVTGRVSAIGFQSYIRPEEWVPLVVQTTSDELAAHTYDLQVVQNDLDGDEVVYTRAGLTVNPGTQTFRTSFRPETLNGGLPASGSDTAADLAKRLRVFLYDPATGKRVVRLGVAGALPQAMESGPSGRSTGQKLILVVGRSPNVSEFAPGRDAVLGLSEACYFVRVDPKRLPDVAAAYGGVDAVVWTDADTGSRNLEPTQLRALRQFVQGGGTLAVIQQSDPKLTSAFDDLLPVRVTGVEEWASPEPLRRILQPAGPATPSAAGVRRLDPWRSARPPFRMADARVADATTVVDSWTTWPDGRRTPLIARRLFGLGCVAWVAQDISDPALAGVDAGWPRLWQRLLDWRDPELLVASAETPARVEQHKARFAGDTTRELGASFVRGINLTGLTAAKISVAFVFFVGYWALAGPGSYLVLAARRRTAASWFVYGAIAAAATLLTVVIAQLVLRGSPQVKHVSLVRVRPDTPARVLSRFGLYLPKDTRAGVALPAASDALPVTLTPFSEPDNASETVNPRDTAYGVPVSSGAEATAVELSIPFRSTLKRLQADFSARNTGGLNGRLTLDANAILPSGTVSNDTGHDLSDVIVIVANPDSLRGDEVLALPEWKKGQTLDLEKAWKSADTKLVQLTSGRPGLALFGSNAAVAGRWTDAVAWLYEDLRAGGAMGSLVGSAWDDSGRNYNRSFPLVSLFGRCQPMTNAPNESTRVDLTRHGVRGWDVSPAVAAGALVVIGKAAGPLPLPLTVDGETPGGTGDTFYQAVLPVDRSASHRPQPPATTPANAPEAKN